MMLNVKVLHERTGANGWVVRADTIRFGKQQIMCEGTMDDCMTYALRPLRNWLVESVTVTINGIDEENGVVFRNEVVCFHRNGSLEVEEAG